MARTYDWEFVKSRIVVLRTIREKQEHNDDWTATEKKNGSRGPDGLRKDRAPADVRHGIEELRFKVITSSPDNDHDLVHLCIPLRDLIDEDAVNNDVVPSIKDVSLAKLWNEIAKNWPRIDIDNHHLFYDAADDDGDYDFGHDSDWKEITDQRRLKTAIQSLRDHKMDMTEQE